MMPYYQLRKTPYMMQWNLNVQREIFSGGVFTIGYLGSRGVHLLLQRELNSPTFFIGPTGRQTFGVFDPARNTVVANPRVNPPWACRSWRPCR